MNRSTSVTLDVMRLVCALVVFASHCAQHWHPGVSAALAPFAHHAVVTFFVLSGYVIAHATWGRPDITFRHYAVARLSRLYSVLLPALALTALLQWVGSQLAPEPYAQISRGSDALRYALAAGFMQSTWFLSAAPPTNGPLWSLSYEAMYYAGFGAAVFMPTRASKCLGVAAVVLLAGPNILLLAPAWVAGVALYGLEHHKAQGSGRGWAWVVTGALLMGAAHTLWPHRPFPMGTAPFYFSASFLSDWVFAAGVALVMAGINRLPLSAGEQRAQQFRRLGDLTFPIYLFHFPIVFFATHVLAIHPTTWTEGAMWAAAAMAVVLPLSLLNERTRPAWRAWADQLAGASTRWTGKTKNGPSRSETVR